MNRRIVSTLLALCAWGAALPASASTPPPSEPLPRNGIAPEFALSWFGDTFTHPGARAGAHVALFERGAHRVMAGLDLGFYSHAGYHTGVLADVTAGYRFTFRSGLFADLRVGAGYLRTFLAGDTFTRGADGTFARAPLAGSNAFAPVQSLMLGWDLAHRDARRAPLSLFAGVTVFEQLPFNGGWTAHVAGQAGLAWRFGRGEEVAR